MKTPAVLSYFTQSNNPADPYLKALQDESNALQATWEAFKRDVDIDFYPRTNIEVEKIEKDIREYKQNMIVFHYSGHADSQQLLFKSGATNAKGLAGLLGEAQNLKIVFLNGCGTYDQVKLLLEKNIKAVVATKGKVSDGVAKEFAEKFYLNVTNPEYNIKEAFQDTINSLKLTNKIPEDTATEPKLWRGLVTSLDTENDHWELHVNEKNAKEIEKKQWWKLGLITPTSTETINGASLEDNIIKYLIIISFFAGIAILIYFAFFKADFKFATLGAALNFSAIFGFKNQQKYKTVELNREYADNEVMKNVKLI
jgi:hypothetical protein